MEQTEQVLHVLNSIVQAVDNPVTVDVPEVARHGLARIRDAVDEQGLDAVLDGPHDGLKDVDPLSRAPTLTDPESLKYFQLYRESYTAEALQLAFSTRHPASSIARPHTGGSFRTRVQRALTAAKFVSATHNANVYDSLSAELDNVLSWQDFNVNRTAQLSDRQPLLLVGMMALTHFDLLNAFEIEYSSAVNFIRAIEHHYLPNPYHNSTHAADVTQALLCILQADGLQQHLSHLELLALILCAIVHDVGHPGFSNPFLTRTQDEQALMYNDQSPNEALSLSIAFKILQAPQCNLFVNMTRDDYFCLRKLMTAVVLGTDMAVHGAILDGAKCLQVGDPAAEVWADDAPRGADVRLAAMKALMHVADLSNAARPAALAGLWTRAVYDEFYKQGDAERELGLDISPLCDRAAVAIAESQKAFLTYVVKPTFESIKCIAPRSFELADELISTNLEQWAALAAAGDRRGVIGQAATGARGEEGDGDEEGHLHVSPMASPFHSSNQASWGSADMLLLLLNDEANGVVGEGLNLLRQRDHVAMASLPS